MSEFLKEVDQRTSLAGMNRMELLLFKIKGEQLFGINVFKVREVIITPEVSSVPKSDPRIVGVADIRGQTMPMIDLAKSLDLDPIVPDEYENSLTIVTEFNSTVQGFLVENVDRIVHLSWDDILPPPDTLMNVNYLTGITRVHDQIVQIVDVEKVLTEVSGTKVEVSDEFISRHKDEIGHNEFFVLGADDSSVARGQLKGILDKLGLANQIMKNGKEAFELINKWANEADKGFSEPVTARILMLISDIEMPEMDGYTLTKNIRKDPRFSDMYIVLSSSLSGGFNDTLTKKVGADLFISKWNPEELGQVIIDRINSVKELAIHKDISV